ncbi:DHHC palmitoyltransferase-domain-containing protein [Phlyctochytrium arcticum]|nr:DHHC palmitoyltransferase-domain-containing protein [Phlyctochytrium arcticum]
MYPNSADRTHVQLDIMQETNIQPPKRRPIKYFSNGKIAPRRPAHVKMPFLITSTARYFTSKGSEDRLFNAWWKVNSWQRPFQVHFVLLLIWFTLTLLGYFFLVLPFAPTDTHIAFYAVGGILAVGAFGLAAHAGSVDVEDPAVPTADLERNISFVKVLGQPVIDRETQYCNICQVVVAPTTKHCKSCNKCVAGFDHHCDFLGQDIGQKNYWTFFFGLMCGWLLAFWVAAIACYAFALYFQDLADFTFTVSKLFNGHKGTPMTVAAVLFVYAVINVLIGLSGLSLTMFHCKLTYLGMTTWRYLEYERNYERGREPSSVLSKKQRTSAQPDQRVLSSSSEHTDEPSAQPLTMERIKNSIKPPQDCTIEMEMSDNQVN